MAGVSATSVVLPGVDGDLTGALLVPDGAPGAPGVVVLPEIDGYCDGTVAAAERLRAAGYVALALDLYAPYGSTPRLEGPGDTMAWLARLDDRRQLSDLACALGWLARRPEVDARRLAVVGFSVGGRYAMLLGTEPHGLGAVAAIYSRPWPGGSIADRALAPGDHVARLAVPVCAVFGADDELVPMTMVERFSRLLEHAGMGHEVHIVPGRHYFANESRPRRYLPASAESAWETVLAFLARQLGPPGHRPGGAH